MKTKVMETIKQIPIEERDGIYQEIMSAIKPLSQKYDESVLRWALNRHLKEQREIQKAKEAKAAAEARLKELGA